MMAPASQPPAELSTLEVAPHLQIYQVPPASYFAPITRLVASAMVIESGRVLLIQRAAHSFQDGLWEYPGGGCEAKDETLIAAAARELWEETGLVAARVVDMVGTYDWLDRGEVWRKVTFLMEVRRQGWQGHGQGQALRVKLDPEEHMGFVWASEEDVVADRCGDIALNWTSQDQKRMVLRGLKR